MFKLLLYIYIIIALLSVIREDFDIINKNYLSFKATNLIKSLIKLDVNYDNDNDKCLKKLITINNEELFKKLIHIDYNNLEVSFNYLSKNKSLLYKNPLYLNLKEKLEIDYLYNEFEIKSKYFHKSLNDFNDIIYDFRGWDKYYETYSNNNNTKYLYYKSQSYNGYYIYYKEFVINNEIIINNQNSIKKPYKFLCNIPSIIINNNLITNNYYSYSYSLFTNNYHSKNINKNNIENLLNIDYHNYDNNNIKNKTDYGIYIIKNLNNYSYELEKNKGSRMIKNNLINNISNRITIESYYFIEKVFIDFHLITIYDEYDYIKLLLSEITNVYNLPIIPPIKFI